MSYTITQTNGNILTTVPDTQLVTNYGGLDLIGQNYDGFGTMFNNDIVHMTENFANSTPPVNPFVGQLWFDTSTNTVNFWNGTDFKPLSVITSSDTAPTNPQVGDEWYNIVNQQLFIWNSYTWILIGPQNQSGTKAGFVVATLTTNSGNVYYLELYANNELIGIVSSVEIDNPGFIGFGNIRPGFNFVTNPGTAPSIVETGLYNVNELTIGDSDQVSLSNDNYDNALFAVNGKNVFIATNGNAAANLAAYTDLQDGNISGIVYMDTLIANTYLGIPPSVVPGTNGEVVYNAAGTFGATSALLINNNNVVTANTLNVNNSATVNSLSVLNNASVSGNLWGASLSSLSFNTINAQVNNQLTVTDHTVTDSIYANVYFNLPSSIIPGTLGDVLFSNSGNIGATTNVVINTNNVAINSNLVVSGTANLVGPVTFNSGSNEFTLANNSGTVAGGALLTDTVGGTSWGTSNIAQLGNCSLTTNGYQYLPSGLMLQWFAGASLSASQNETVITANFPFPFPSICLFASISGLAVGSDYGEMPVFSLTSWSNLQYSFYYERNADHGGMTVSPLIWAVGY